MKMRMAGDGRMLVLQQKTREWTENGNGTLAKSLNAILKTKTLDCHLSF